MYLLQGLPILFAAITLIVSQVNGRCTDNVEADYPMENGTTEVRSDNPSNFKNTEGSYTIFGYTSKELFVNLNGVLSINSNFSSTNTKEFPISDTPPFIAGFWDQISLKKNGRPYGVIAYIEMNNSSELFQSYKARYKSFLGERFGKCIEQFQPTHIFLATWKDAVQTSSGESITFQIALMSREGSVETYALLLYENIGSNTSNEAVKVGFNAGDGVTNITHPLESRVQDLNNSTNAETCGVYVYRIDTITEECLELKFINNTPLVSESHLMANFRANREGVMMNCSIPEIALSLKDCSSGMFTHTFEEDQIWKHMTEKYTLIVKAMDPITDETVILRGKFRVFGHQERYFCSVNMINTGMQPIPIGGCLEYIRVGNTTNFTCKMDGDEIPCGDLEEEIPDPQDPTRPRHIHHLILTGDVINNEKEVHRFFVKPNKGCKSEFCITGMMYRFKVAE